MLIFLPTTTATEKASAFLHSQQLAHQVIAVPETLGYKTGSDCALLITELSVLKQDIPMLLTRQKFVVMRVFKNYVEPQTI